MLTPGGVLNPAPHVLTLPLSLNYTGNPADEAACPSDQLLMKAGKQHFNPVQPFKPITKQPDHSSIRHPIFQLQTQEAHETEAIPYLIFDPIIRQVVQLLEHLHLEHPCNVDGFGSRLTFSVLFMHPVEIRAKRFPAYPCLQANQDRPFRSVARHALLRHTSGLAGGCFIC